MRAHRSVAHIASICTLAVVIVAAAGRADATPIRLDLIGRVMQTCDVSDFTVGACSPLSARIPITVMYDDSTVTIHDDGTVWTMNVGTIGLTIPLPSLPNPFGPPTTVTTATASFSRLGGAAGGVIVNTAFSQTVCGPTGVCGIDSWRLTNAVGDSLPPLLPFTHPPTIADFNFLLTHGVFTSESEILGYDPVSNVQSERLHNYSGTIPEPSVLVVFLVGIVPVTWRMRRAARLRPARLR